eukprot:SAG11_NODE_4631_length_1827_cov_1.282407_1_plen_346_part_00
MYFYRFLAFLCSFSPFAAVFLSSKCFTVRPQGGYFNTFPIPFGTSALVTVRADPMDCPSGEHRLSSVPPFHQIFAASKTICIVRWCDPLFLNLSTGCCGGGYLNVRGTENLPVVLPGSGIPLPSTARLKLHKNDWQIAQPAAHVPVMDVPTGDGLMFMSTLSVETQPNGGDRAGGGYIEGCWQFYNSAETPYPGLVVGTGVEDYFDSSYYFGADAGIFGTDYQIPSLTFRNDLSGLTFFQREGGYERLSAYRFHNADPLAFSGGGKLLWWVGQCKPFGGEDGAELGRTTKCGNPVPPTPHDALGKPYAAPLPATELDAGEAGAGRRLGRSLTPINATTYGWYYHW